MNPRDTNRRDCDLSSAAQTISEGQASCWRHRRQGQGANSRGRKPAHGRISQLDSPWWKSGVSTETGEAPAGQGATTENVGKLWKEQRRPAGCPPVECCLTHHGLLSPSGGGPRWLSNGRSGGRTDRPQYHLSATLSLPLPTARPDRYAARRPEGSTIRRDD
jgi:hypothetical protein